MDPQAQPPVSFFAMLNGLTSRMVISLIMRADVFPHLVMPVGPLVTAFRAPVVEMMRNAAVSEDLRHSIGRSAVLPRTTTGREMDVATPVLMEIPRVTLIRHVVHRVI